MHTVRVLLVLALSPTAAAFCSGSARPMLRHAVRAVASPATMVLEVPTVEERKDEEASSGLNENGIACVEDECVGDRSDAGISYAAQFDDLFSKPLRTSRPVPKPSNEAQALEKSAKQVFNSDVFGTLMRPMRDRKWSSTDTGRAVLFTVIHALGIFAPFKFFSWRMLGIQFLLYCASGMGITYSYHRQLAHRSFESPKWLEYSAAYCGMLAMQGSPAEWVSDHRYHHLHTETPLDPHSSYEGFYWSHLGWMLDSEVYQQRCGDSSNVNDLWKQPYYKFTNDHYGLILLSHWAMVGAIGGFAAVCWRAFFTALLWNVTWFVNSAAHLWGRQEYKTGDQSRNNWWVGFLAFGEGWHNNHHAFEYSARHGLRPRQFDITWQVIRLFKAVGLVTRVKLPTEAAKARLALAA